MSTSPFTTVYCLGAGAFFSACAYAQLNDPDPFFWAAVYLTGGLGLNILVLTFTKDYGFISNFSFMYSMFIVSLIAWISSKLIPKLNQVLFVDDTQESESPPEESSSLIWTFLEFEEGREIAGLLILLLHVSQIPSLASGHGGKEASVTDAKTTRSVSKILPAVAATISICVGIYMWVYYQPQLNRRLNVEHCNGQLQFGN